MLVTCCCHREAKRFRQPLTQDVLEGLKLVLHLEGSLNILGSKEGVSFSGRAFQPQDIY